MRNLTDTYRHIANILSFETTSFDLKETISDPQFDWDAIVIEGSKHLVLPAIYCRLKSKKLLHCIPLELNNYLEEITSINRNRNTAITKQIHSLTQLLNEHKINHVFLKGSALLIVDCYEDIAERMIGDIDILIGANQLDTAFNLLKNNSYSPITQTMGSQFFEHKHLPRLKTETYICAVELHRKLFVSYKDTDLTNDTILKKKQHVHNVATPYTTHLLKHNILNYQINDKGSLYNSISFRSAYDTIILLKQYNGDTNWLNTKKINSYFNIIGLFFKDIGLITAVRVSFSASFYLFKLKNIKFYKFWNKLINLCSFTSIIFSRIYFYIKNETYRKAVYKDRKRIFKHINSILNKS